MAFRCLRTAAIWIHGWQVCQRGTSCRGHGRFLKRAVERRGKGLKYAAKIHQESGLLTQIIYVSSTPEITFFRGGGQQASGSWRERPWRRGQSAAEGSLHVSSRWERGVERPRAAHTWPCASSLRPWGKLTGSGCYLSAAIFVTARSWLATFPVVAGEGRLTAPAPPLPL